MIHYLNEYIVRRPEKTDEFLNCKKERAIAELDDAKRRTKQSMQKNNHQHIVMVTNS